MHFQGLKRPVGKTTSCLVPAGDGERTKSLRSGAAARCPHAPGNTSHPATARDLCLLPQPASESQALRPSLLPSALS